MWHAPSHAETPEGIFSDDVILIHTSPHSIHMHIVCSCTFTYKHSRGAPLSPAPAWRSPCRSSRQPLTGHSTGCISPSWLRSSSLRLSSESSRNPGSCPYPLAFTRAQATAATDQCYCRSTGASVIPDPHRLPLSLSLSMSRSLSPSLSFNVSLSHSVPLPLTLTLALAMLHSAGRDYLIALGWKQWVGGGTEGRGRDVERERCLQALRPHPPPPPGLQTMLGGERLRESGACGARIQHLLKGIFPFIPIWKTAKEN